MSARDSGAAGGDMRALTISNKADFGSKAEALAAAATEVASRGEAGDATGYAA